MTLRSPFVLSPRLRAGLFAISFLTGAWVARAESVAAADAAGQTGLIDRLRALNGQEDKFPAEYRPIYRAMLPWYEKWGVYNLKAVDSWMTEPDVYATELADTLTHGKNFIDENRGASFPLVFEQKQPDGKIFRANYYLNLPDGFGEKGRTFPLVIGLHGSGWIGHKISFVRGGKKGGRVFQVTPIDEGEPWQLDFLNAYLDTLLKLLPIDRDRIYVEGHSLGGMATWEWALQNPERFAAISPRSGIGEPYRAIRLKNIPAWVIHGEKDDVIFPGFAEEMVTALQSNGASVKYSLLKGVEHNMPSDLDEEAVIDWYLQQSRSKNPTPADPRDALGLDASGFSKWETVEIPGGYYLKSDELNDSNTHSAGRHAAGQLFGKAHQTGEWIDHPLRREINAAGTTVRLWLGVPQKLRTHEAPDSDAVLISTHRVARFYYRGDATKAAAHVQSLAPELAAAGHPATGSVWITPLSLWPDTPTAVSECWVELK